MPSDSPSPEDEARLRRLLAASRATEPAPDDVVARLDATLAELGQERAGAVDPNGTDATEVVPLAGRRRRAMVGLLAAAAVVVVAGVGVTEVLRSPSGSDSPTAAEVASEAESTGADRNRLESDDTGQESAPGGADEFDAAPDAATSQRLDIPVEVRETEGPLPLVRGKRVERDALGVRRDLPDRARTVGGIPVLHAPQGFTCEAEGWGVGTFAAVRYAGRNAVLAFREPSEQNQVAELLQCGTGAVLRSVTLAAP